jgi:hypothetical protein
MLEYLKRTPLYRLYLVYDRIVSPVRWWIAGCPVPPPGAVKRTIVRLYARHFELRRFVETGTYLGATVRAMRPHMDHIWSIELDETLAERAQRMFSRDPGIDILQGDSGERLAEVLSVLDGPCLFWLDSHWSGGMTARGAEESPVLHELGHIFNHAVDGHVVLIDDARCFTGSGGYPMIDELREFVASRQPDWTVTVADDIIRLHAASDEMVS